MVDVDDLFLTFPNPLFLFFFLFPFDDGADEFIVLDGEGCCFFEVRLPSSPFGVIGLFDGEVADVALIWLHAHLPVFEVADLSERALI